MIRWLFIRFLLPLIVFLLVRSVLKTVFRTFGQVMHAPDPPGAARADNFPAGGELKKDPVCGTYVSAGAAVTKRVNGELLHFCSPECRDKYRAT